MTRWLCAGLLVTVAACGGDDDAAPTVSDFSCTPTDLVANQGTAVSCDFQFTDDSLVVDNVHVELTQPDDSVEPLDTAFANPDMLVDGPGYFSATLTPNGVGTATLSLRLTGGGHASNTVSQDFTCLAP